MPFFKKPGLAQAISSVAGSIRHDYVWNRNAFQRSYLITATTLASATDLVRLRMPDVVGDPKAGVRQAGGLEGFGPLYYNPAAFAAPRGLTFGDSGRNFLRNPTRLNFDMSLQDFTLTERMALEFRAEAFNIFNHTEWGESCR